MPTISVKRDALFAALGKTYSKTCFDNNYELLVQSFPAISPDGNCRPNIRKRYSIDPIWILHSIVPER